MVASLIPLWTSASEAVKIRLKAHDLLEEAITMQNMSVRLRHLCQLATMLLSLIIDAVCDLGLCLRLGLALAAENLFLRKPWVLYQERQAKPWQVTNAI
jgi:hypothetical protein